MTDRDRDRDPLEWLREIGNSEEIEKRLKYANHVHGGAQEVFGALLAVVPALIDVAVAARRLEAARQAYRGTHEDARASAGAAIDWREANDALLATVREQMERAK